MPATSMASLYCTWCVVMARWNYSASLLPLTWIYKSAMTMEEHPCTTSVGHLHLPLKLPHAYFAQILPFSSCMTLEGVFHWRTVPNRTGIYGAPSWKRTPTLSFRPVPHTSALSRTCVHSSPTVALYPIPRTAYHQAWPNWSRAAP